VTDGQAREVAREILKIVPLVMRTVAAELRAAGELPAPAHFSLLSLLATQSRTVSELAAIHGVSLPTMSNSVTALVQRGWVKRRVSERDRRVMRADVTPAGRAALERVGRCAEEQLSEVLTPLPAEGRRRLQAGLRVLRELFEGSPGRRRERASPGLVRLGVTPA
jgi:DNA-binding MarR family transcriptional regulator